jgi:hypothetical protein
VSQISGDAMDETALFKLPLAPRCGIGTYFREQVRRAFHFIMTMSDATYPMYKLLYICCNQLTVFSHLPTS